MSNETKIKWGVTINGTDNASNMFKKVSDSASDSSKNLNKHTDTLAKLSLIYMGAKEIIGDFVEALHSFLEPAIAAEAMTDRLGVILKQTGNYSAESVDDIEKFSLTLERVTGVSHETINSVQAMNLSFGMTVEQSEAATLATAKLAKLMGGDFESANQAIRSSLIGMDKGIAKLIPSIRGLSEEALKSGGAINVINQQIQLEDNDTFARRYTELKLSINGFIESIGLAILNTGILQTVMKFLEIGIRSLTESFNNGSLLSFFQSINPVTLILNIIKTTFQGIADISEFLFDRLTVGFEQITLSALQFVDSLRNIPVIGKYIPDLSEQIKEMSNSLTNSKNAVDNFLNRKEASPLVDQFNQLISSSKKIGETFLNVSASKQIANQQFTDYTPQLSREELKKRQDLILSINSQIKELGLQGSDQLITGFTKSIDKINKLKIDNKILGVGSELEQLQQATIKNYQYQAEQSIKHIRQTDDEKFQESIDNQRTLYDDLLKNKLISEQQFADAKNKIDENVSDRQWQKAGTVISAISGGLNSIITSIGNYFGAVGQAVAQIVNFLNQTQEQMKTFINGLIDSIIQLPQNIIQNIPVIIQTIINRIPDLIQAAIMTIVLSFPELLLGSFTAAFSALPNMLTKLFSAQFWSNIVSNLYTSLMNTFQNFWQSLFFGSNGSSMQQTLEQGGQLFNPDANAGNDVFKVKDYTQNAAAQNFDARVQTVVTQGSKGLITSLIEGMSAVGQAIWDGLYSALQNAWSFFQSIGNQIWSGIQSGLSSIGGSLGGVFGGGSFLGSIGGTLGSIGGSIGGSLGFSEGGVVPGLAQFAGNSTKNDTVPILSSPGEYYISREAMANKDLSGPAKEMGVSLGNIVNYFTFNIGAGSNLTDSQLKNTVVPAVVSELQKQSQNGKQIINQRGVYR